MHHMVLPLHDKCLFDALIGDLCQAGSHDAE